MNVWLTEGNDIVCQDCASPDDEGPFADGGGEADTPQHCAYCGVYLGNPWTQDCVDYVAEALAEWPARGRVEVLRQWRDALATYVGQLTPEQLEAVERFNKLPDGWENVMAIITLLGNKGG